jgi:hypothetical protein
LILKVKIVELTYPEYLRAAFQAVHQVLQPQGALRDFPFLEGYYLLLDVQIS